MKYRFALIVIFFVLAMAAAPCRSPASGAMKMTAASFPVPENSDPVQLSTLTYGGMGGYVEVKSVRLEILSPEGAEPLRLAWAFTASNGKPQLRRIRVSVSLLAANKKRIATASKNKFLKSANTHQEFVTKMKVKAKVWASAKTVLVRVDFLSM